MKREEVIRAFDKWRASVTISDEDMADLEDISRKSNQPIDLVIEKFLTKKIEKILKLLK